MSVIDRRKFFMYFVTLFAIFTVICLNVRTARAAQGFLVRSADFYPTGAKFTFQVASGGSFSFTLPGAFNLDSLRCLTMEKLSSIETEALQVIEDDPEELEPFQKSVLDVQRSVDILESRSAALNQTLTMIASPFSNSDGGYKIDSGALSGYIDYLTNAQKLRLDVASELVDVGIALAEALKVLKRARDEFDIQRLRIEGKKPFNPGNIITVSGTTHGQAVLLFEAYTPAAGWGVGYEMALNSATGLIKTKMNAVARQRTGLDVNGGLSFHTRAPSFAIAAPDVRPLTVGIRPDQKGDLRLSGARNFAADMVFQEAAGEMAVAEKPSPAPPQTVSTLANVAINGSGKVDGDGSAAKVMLGVFELKSAPILVAIPEQSGEAWIVASLDEAPPAFLPGNAELAVDGAATGQASIPESVGAIQIPFGKAARLTAKKTPYISTRERSWLVNGVVNDGYTLEITSRMDREQEITVRDRVPFATTDKVTVDVKKVDPAPSERDKENRLLWKLKIKPGETKKITVEYTITFPGGETLEYR
ncbi:MAG: DUF4139 domain-containing protein [Synergistaceae bacterium]|jgi:uncharacterized protein (TIGR02231 family)|nr:DUF4139 domain-containing protein [Synergistaceae bacterium]